MRGPRSIGLFLPPLLGGVLCIVIIAVVLLRLFGVIFFWASTSTWAVVPALVIVAMLFVAGLAQSPRRYLVSVLAICYLCSIYFDGWPSVTARIAEGGSAWLEVTEAVVVGIFLLLNLVGDGRMSDHTKQRKETSHD